MDDYGDYIEPCGAPDYEVEPGTLQDIPVLWAMELNGDTIVTSTFDLDGLTQDSASFNTESAAVFIDLTSARSGWTYCITHTITTAAGRTLKRRLRIRVRSECLC